MELLRNRLTVYALTPEEVESMLICRFGGKIEPVDKAGLARARQVQIQQEARQLAFQASKQPKEIV
ncbi:MAG: hypothetical protein P4N59_14885 [Negativicutes bacterium]|nr:hypothetical protein [Negativicutes bacterium]